jgi:hypothetical protein
LFITRRYRSPFCGFLLLVSAIALCPQASAQPYVVGDSHCRQIAQLMVKAGWKTTPKHGPKDGATIKDLPAQLTRIPMGSDVIACAGTNDSNPAVEEDVTPYVHASVDVAMLRGLRVVWIGPAYITRTGWRLKATLLDEKLSRVLKPYRAMIYLSMQPAVSPGECLKDYVHLKDRCYRDLARKAVAELN